MTPSLHTIARGFAGALISLALVVPASAALFTDVPDGSLYQGAVEGLTLHGVVNGYADGNYRPRQSVNRAEFLTLLYRATGKSTDDAGRLCFSDVEPGAWYEKVVCAAAEAGIVNGYPDHSFKPGKEVTRGEAAKMLSVAFGLSGEVNSNVLFNAYTDVPADRWDAVYVSLLLERDVLPLSGQETSAAFHSDWALTRGEAALMIWGTMQSLQRFPVTSSSSVSSSSAESSEAASSSAMSSSSMSTSSSSSAASTPATPSVVNVAVPFNQEGTATKRTSAVYRFKLDAAKTLSITVKKGKTALETPSCRLFRLRADGISNEYYFGTMSAGSCLLKVALAAGDYQLEISARADTSFSVSAADAKSDGNDGFREAKSLRYGSTTVRGSLIESDLGEYYTFTVADLKSMMVDLISDDALQCMIFPGDDVELASFEGPICNQSYDFPKGTYTVWIGHDPAGLTRSPFSLQLH